MTNNVLKTVSYRNKTDQNELSEKKLKYCLTARVTTELQKYEKQIYMFQFVIWMFGQQNTFYYPEIFT